jgi:sec-independent protein translocase protein TatB
MAITPPIQIASISMADSLILMVLALVVFGPRRLPQIGRQIGKLMYEFRKASNDFKFQMEEELRVSEEADRRKKEEAERAARTAALPPPTQTIDAAVSTTAPEQESVSAPPDPAQYPPQTPPTTDAMTPDTTAPDNTTTPVIKPPSTGEQVEAAKPGADAVAGPAVAISPEPSSTPLTNGTEPPASGQGSGQDPTSSETVTQHG